MRLDTFDFTKLRRVFIHRREIRKLTQGVASRQMGMSRAQLCDLETGRIKDPRLSTLVRWASGLGYHLDLDLRSRAGTTDLIAVPHQAVYLLVASAVDRLWSQWHNQGEGCCTRGCCADCYALGELMDAGWLDSLYGAYVKSAGGTHSAWDSDNEQVGRDWLLPAWKDPHQGCAYTDGDDD